MNPVATEMIDVLMHYGMPRRSGRYPWGSGDNPYQHGQDFLGRVDELRKQGFTYTDEKTGKTYTGDTAIAKSMGLSTTQFRTEISLAKGERRALLVARAKSLKEDGLGDTAIGREMGINESTVRSLLNSVSEDRMNQARKTADFIKEQIDGGKEMIDVGAEVNREINVSKETFDKALYLLQREGYPVYPGRFEQVTNRGQFTTQKVICKPGTEWKEIYDLDRVSSLNDYITRDGGDTYEKKFHYPTSLDSKRLKVLLADDPGVDGRPSKEKDGIIEIRRGVADLSLGESRYAQVRILVDGTHYLKGMAVYSDNMPDGIDVVFNTSKTDMSKTLKPIKNDPDNPFGSAIKDVEQGGQYWYDPKTGKRVSASQPGAKLGLINKRADEGDWSEWKDALPSQFLSKQAMPMIKKQLTIAKDDKIAEFQEYCELTNPTIKKHLLKSFADTCDAAAVHLQAAALPGQKYHVIIPVNSLKDNEIYAPNYENGTKLALIRYPHGGTFEIPILTVNNKHADAKKLLGSDVTDAVGINKQVADRLSGADFDGDTVMCIPTHDKTGKVKVTSTPALKGLEGFNHHELYGYDTKSVDANGNEHYYRNGKEFKVMKNTGTQMGIITNLISDMTLAGANETELAAAVRHSMVVVDAEKHKLDYRQSEIDNNIAALHKRYQGKTTGGAATIISRAKGQATVTKRQGTPKVNLKDKEWYDPTKPEGSLIWKDADDATYQKTRINKRTGEVITTTETRTQKSTKMMETDDAYTLVSNMKHPKEILYADYANSMKALANQARLEVAKTQDIKYSASAAKTYAAEVSSLNAKLNNARLNAPRERAAQRLANAEVEAKKKANPDMKTSDIKKASQQALDKYRKSVGAIARSKRNINITDNEWTAIMAGAISPSKLTKILNNTDVDALKARATPRTSTQLSQAKINRIKSLSASNYTLAEIAAKIGCSTSTVSNYLKGGN